MRSGTVANINNASRKLINKELNQLQYNIKTCSVDKLYEVELWGRTFDAKPFLVNAAGFFSQAYRDSVFGYIAEVERNSSDYITLESIRKQCDFNFYVLRSLIPSLYNVGMTEESLYLCINNPQVHLIFLTNAVIECINNVIEGNTSPHIKYTVTDICNTQAACFYISMLWVFQKAPRLRVLFAPYMKKFDLDVLIEEVLPEGCLHRQYIMGQITDVELYQKYYENTNGASAYVRELLSLCSDGAYDGHAPSAGELNLAGSILGLTWEPLEYKLNCSVSLSYYIGGGYTKQLSQIKNLTAENSRLLEEKLRAESKTSTARAERKELSDKVAELTKEINSLQKALAKRDGVDHLEAKIADLERQLRQRDDEVEQLFNERLQLKQLISKQKKKLKCASISVVDNTEVDDEKFVETAEQSVFNKEFAIDTLKDMSFTFVGGLSDVIISKLETLGFTHMYSFTRQHKSCNVDFAIILTSLCSHADVRKLEREIGSSDVEIVYFNGSNVDQLIKQLYNHVKEG